MVVDGADHDGTRPGNGTAEVAANKFSGSVEALEPFHLSSVTGGYPRGETVAGFDIGGSSFGRNRGDACEIESRLPDLLFDPLAVCLSNYHLSQPLTRHRYTEVPSATRYG